MKLTPLQSDTLTELMNIATGRAAASLSGILRQRVGLRVIEIWSMNFSEMKQFLEQEVQLLGSVIEQKFSGGMAGNSLLVMTHENAHELVKILLQQNSELAGLTSTEQSILGEVGNIVLNACVSMFANQTGRRVHFSLPRVLLNVQASHLALDLADDWEGNIEGLVLKSNLTIGQARATIYILILLTIDTETLQALIDETLNRF